MPGLKAFGRLWIVGSDDFVYPAALEAIINVSWLTAVAVIYGTHDISRTCLKERMLETYVLGCLVLLVVSLPILVVLSVCSARGAIMDTRKRRHVAHLIYVRVILFITSVIWDILGSVWLSADIKMCDVTSATVQIIIALVVCNWLKCVSILVGVAIVFDPLGSVSLHGVGYTGSTLRRSAMRRQLWHTRCRLLCCCLYSDDTAEAFRDVANHMSTLVGDVDLVPSDVVAGLILLQQRHSSGQLCTGPDPAQPSIQNTSRSPTLHDRPPWMTLEKAAHFMRFALGVYGWPWYLHNRLLTNFGPLWRRIICCAYRRGKRVVTLGDNCCLCNTAALQQCTEVEEKDLLYVSFINHIYKVAFLVAVDHASQSIVVSIRGTLSVTDALTDLCLDSVYIDGPEKEDERAHKGMLEAARYVYYTLGSTEVLERALIMYPEYTVTVTGHSLGAGAAALVTKMLRFTYPNVICFAFSPPGGLVSRSVSEQMQQYVMSVVCGDDLVPRLSVSAVEKLKNDLVEALVECPLSKHQLLYRACCNCACGASHDLVSGQDVEEAVTPGHQTPLFNAPANGTSNYESLVDVADRTLLEEARAAHVPLFLPGHVLHVSNCVTERDGSCSAELSWRSIDDFTEIRVTRTMFSDHLPDAVHETLRHLVAIRAQE